MDEQKTHYESLLATQKTEYDRRIAALEKQLDQQTSEYEMHTVIRRVGSVLTIKMNEITQT